MTGFGAAKGARLACLAMAGATVAAWPAAAGMRLSLEGGFVPDPMSLAIGFEARLPAEEAVRGCPGFMPDEAGLELDYGRPFSPLNVYAGGEAVVGLVVIGPDGISRCGALGADGAATVRIEPALEGEHAVLPLVAAAGPAEARVLLSERGLAPDEIRRAFGRAPDAPAAGLATEAEPAFGRHALPAEGRTALPLTLSAAADARIAGPGCYGWIDPARPDVVLGLDAAEPTLSIRARSDFDTTLVVAAPDGRVLCDDDSHGFDPEVAVTDAPAGEWAIWVGIYSGDGGEAATLELSRAAGAAASAWTDGPAGELDAAAPPASGLHALAAGGQTSVPVELSGGVPAFDFDWSCAGRIDPSRPDAVIRLEADAPALHLRARSREDTTLVVRSPAGALHCDDDSYGFDPAVEVAPAPAGDYAVWVGVFDGDGGGEAALEAGFSAAAVGGSSPQDAFLGENPFAGRTLQAATDVLDVLMEEGLSEVLVYDTLEPLGTEGFVLHGVTLADPTDPGARLRIERIAVDDLDLDGLAATGEPSRFSLALDGIDYAALAEGGGALAMMPALPLLAGNPRLSLAASMLPPAGDATRREVTLALDLERQFSLRLAARFDWTPGPDGAPPTVEAAATEAMEIEFENRGFLGQLIRAQATEMGMEPAQAAQMLLSGLGEALAPVEPGSAPARLLDVLAQAVEQADQRGVIRLHLATDEPRGLEALLEEFQDGKGFDDRVRLDLVYEPMP